MSKPNVRFVKVMDPQPPEGTAEVIDGKDGWGSVSAPADLDAFVPLDKAFQRAAKRAGLVAAPYTPSGSVTARWAVEASTQADIAQIVRLTKCPMTWEEHPGGGWYVFLVYGADVAKGGATS